MEKTKIENEQRSAGELAGTADGEMSASKKKRLERQKKNSRQKRENLIWRIVGYAVIILVAAGILYLIGSLIYRSSKRVTASADYSSELTDTGYIRDVNAISKVDLVDYKNITVPMSEVEFTDEEVQADIDQKLETYKTLNEDPGKAVEEGDTVSIDYVGSIDGVEFDGGNSGGAGYDLEIGSDSFIDGFEDQIIGHKAGEVFTIDVTFPEDYNAQELAGKDAQFEITLHGIYETSVFDDAFVKEHLSSFADSAEGYRQYLKDTNLESNLEDWVDNYIVENSTVSSYPKSYLRSLKSLQKYTAQQTYEYMNQMYLSYTGAAMYDSFDDYTGMSEDEYDLSLIETCKEIEKEALVYQAIAESEGYVPSEDDLKADLEETGSADNYDQEVETYGLGYLMQQTLQQKVLEKVLENVKVE